MKLNPQLNFSINMGKRFNEFRESVLAKLPSGKPKDEPEENLEQASDQTEQVVAAPHNETEDKEDNENLVERLKNKLLLFKQKLPAVFRKKPDLEEDDIDVVADYDKELRPEMDGLSSSVTKVKRPINTNKEDHTSSKADIYRLTEKRLNSYSRKKDRREFKERLADRRSQVRLTASGEPERDRRLANRQANALLYKKAG